MTGPASRLTHTQISTSLKEKRRAAGLTQAALADLIDVSRKTINTVENGIFIPSTLLALKLARALDTQVDALFSLSD